ncbi:MAG: hypothetical protein QOK88_09410 [Nitrososphaeraceae archaeon]|nr:hypothetical protein [Nitrososphaeraceae archaeon]
MTLDQILQQEIKDSELWLSREKEEPIYKRDLKKRIELINWVLQNMKNPEVEICSLIEYRVNETIQEIKKKDSIFESDILDSELRILDWIFYQVCVNMQDQTGIRTIQSDKF